MVRPDARELLRFRCSLCDKAFGRAEHLRRHELIHNEVRPFKCNHCAKDFIRRDALQRHEATHNAAPSLLQKGGRACSQCATAKARCSGEQISPCARCRDRNLQCAYPPTTAPKVPPHVLHTSSGAVLPAHVQTQTPQYQVFQSPMSIQHPAIQDAGMVGLDYWDPNVLSSSNWLDVLDPADLGHFSFDGFSSYASPFPPRMQQPHERLQQTSLPSNSPAGVPAARSQAQTDSPASVFSSQSNAITDSITSQGTYDDSPSKGDFYVDGEPARHPRVKRRKLSSTTKRSVDLQTNTDVYSLALPSASAVQADPESRVNVPLHIYEDTQLWYQKLCVEAPAPWSAFSQTAFISQETLEYLLGLYFKHFDSAMPIVHRGLFHQTTHERSEILAMAALGSHYLPEESHSAKFSASLHEMSRRCLLYIKESISKNEACSPSQDSAELLYVIGAAFCGDQRLLRSALDCRTRLVAIHEKCKRQFDVFSSQNFTTGSSVDALWTEWTQQESTIRLGNAAWLLDCLLAYAFLEKPFLTLKDATLPLPCTEKVWNAVSASVWQTLVAHDSLQPNLNQALQGVYIDKKLSPDRGEFARIIIIHGLYQRQWEVERYYEDPLSQWTPTANRQSSAELLPKTPIWLPSVSTFNKWQNSACDALDILHWQANATIGQASGLEHPTVLHLHLARIILLTPYRHMVELSRALINGAGQTKMAKTDQQLIQRWAIQHRFKARLAIIHAGVVFWHVRRYSIDAFYESPAVGLAALVLWAFGTYTNQKVNNRSSLNPVSSDHTPVRAPHQASRERSPESDDAKCEIILLDRPTDDELVQQFIRNGHNMRAHLTGVGDLYAARGPERALTQGCKLLGSLRSWAVSDQWLQLLQGLLDVSRKHKGDG